MSYKDSKISVIIAAAGSGTRMKSDRPKQMLLIDGRTILQLTASRFGYLPQVGEIIFSVSESILDACRQDIEILALPKPMRFVLGGKRRQDSVRNALAAVSSACSVVAVHDAARPFFAASVIPESLEMLGSVPGVIAAVPATYTMKEVRNGHVRRTIPRETLYRVNTPQIFRKNELAAAFIKADADKITVTDDAMLLEHAGYDVAVCSDTPDNLKITTASDLATAAEIYRKNKNLFRGNHD